MKKILFSFVVFAGFIFLLTPSHQALAAQFNISIKDDFFTPFAPMIQPGDTVVWTNNGAMPHTVTGDDETFDSGIIAPGGTYSHTFDQGPVVNYYCKIHSTAYSQGGRAMNAVILINSTAPAPSPSPNPGGSPSPSPSPSYSSGLVAPNPSPVPTPEPSPVVIIMPKNPYPYPTGTLINDSGTIYLIVGNTKLPFTNFAAFKGLGYSLKNVVKASSADYTMAGSYKIESATQEHPWSSWLVYKGTIYYSHKDGMIGVPSWQIFLAAGGTNTLILPMNKADIAVLNSKAPLPNLEVNDSRLNN